MAKRRTTSKNTVSMANLVRDVLIPVEPSQLFVRELGRSLGMKAARSHQSLLRRYRTALVITAAAFGSLASVAGVVALIIRQRTRERTRLPQ